MALTEPLSERLIAALVKPVRLFAAVLAASPIDAAVALVWGIGAIVLSIAMPMAVNLLSHLFGPEPTSPAIGWSLLR